MGRSFTGLAGILNAREGNKQKEIHGTSTIGTSPTSIPHNLNRKPKNIQATPKKDARVWIAGTADKTQFFLESSALNTIVDWVVR